MTKSRAEYQREWRKRQPAAKLQSYKRAYEKQRSKQPARRWTILVSMCNLRKNRQNSRDLLHVTKEEFITWADQNRHCIYCGSKELGQGSGVDRADSTKGYTIENMVSCCRNCNEAKGQLSTEEFKAHITRIYEFFVKG